MIAEHIGAREAEHGERCHAGRSTDNPCWRLAAERRWPDDETPTVCPEHARLGSLVDDKEALLDALERIDSWVKDAAADDRFGDLTRLAHGLRDEAVREYTRAHVKVDAARQIAKQGPPEEEGDPPLTFEQEEELARRIVQADSLNDARALLEDIPEEVLERRDRWAMVAAIMAAHEAAAEEARHYRVELGL